MNTLLDLALGPLFRIALLLLVLGLLWHVGFRAWRGTRDRQDVFWWSGAAVLLVGAAFLADHLLLVDAELGRTVPTLGQDAGAVAAMVLLPVLAFAGYRVARRRTDRRRLIAVAAAFSCLVCGLLCHFERLSPVDYQTMLLLHALCAETFIVALVVPLLRRAEVTA